MSQHPEPLSRQPDTGDITLLTLLISVRLGLRWIMVGALLGPLCLFTYTHTLAATKAMVLLNNSCVTMPPEEARQESSEKDPEKTKDKDASPKIDKECALTFNRWRTLAENLPALASQWRDHTSAAPDQSVVPAFLSEALWWEKNVVPVYGLSQAESKRFPLMDEKLKAASTEISQLRMTAGDPEAQRAQDMLDWSLRWIRDGATFMDLKALLDQYRSEIVVSGARIASETPKIENETEYLRGRLTRLKAILAENPAGSSSDQTRVDVGRVDTHFLPLRTQINAAEVALAEQDSQILRLKDQAARLDVLGQFLDRATPLLALPYQGTHARVMTDQLLGAADTLALSIPDADYSRKSSVERVRGDIRRIAGRYSILLPELSRQITPPSIGLTFWGLSFLGGALLGYFAFLLRQLLATITPKPA